MSSPLAPSRSIRPAPRVTPEERRVVDRAAANEMMEAFAALEGRADMDPYLADNPMRRLGYREYGGLESVDYIPATRGGSWAEQGVTRTSSLSDAELASLREMQPDRFEAYFAGESPYLFPPGTVFVGSDYFSEPVLAHEFGHAGHDLIQRMSMRDLDMSQRFRDADTTTPGRAGWTFEEGAIELSDNPEDSWVNTRGEVDTMAPTIEMLEHAREGTRTGDRLRRYEQIMQEIAQEELTRRGEPPRAVMQTPEPEPRGGLLGLFDLIRGN